MSLWPTNRIDRSTIELLNEAGTEAPRLDPEGDGILHLLVAATSTPRWKAHLSTLGLSRRALEAEAREPKDA
jgi:hypothetical protein